MGRFTHWASLLSAMVVLAAALDTSASAQLYRLTPLGALGELSSAASAVNNNGQVVGTSHFPKGDISSPFPDLARAFVYSAGVRTEFAGDNSVANDINSSGQIVGHYTPPEFEYAQIAYVYDSGSIMSLGTLGGPWSIATAISDNGHVVGRSDANATSGHPFLHVDGLLADLGTFGGYGAAANDVSSSGQVVGSTVRKAGLYDVFSGFYYQSGSPTRLFADNSTAHAINDLGQVVGVGYANGINQGFVYSGGITKYLGTLGGASSSALAINELGQIVGRSWTDLFAIDHGFLYSNGTMKDLNSLVDSSAAGWLVTAAYDINDHGWIVGTAKNLATEKETAILLTPVPEPASVVLVAIGLGVICGLRGRATRSASCQIPRNAPRTPLRARVRG